MFRSTLTSFTLLLPSANTRHNLSYNLKLVEDVRLVVLIAETRHLLLHR